MHTENVAWGGWGGDKIFPKVYGASNISLLTFQKSRGGEGQSSPRRGECPFVPLLNAVVLMAYIVCGECCANTVYGIYLVIQEGDHVREDDFFG